MESSNLNDLDIECVKAYADHNMSVTSAANYLYVCYQTVNYHLKQVEKKTGLNPRKFYDLVKLLEMFEVKA